MNAHVEEQEPNLKKKICQAKQDLAQITYGEEVLVLLAYIKLG
jgi:hypothetical protein